MPRRLATNYTNYTNGTKSSMQIVGATAFQKRLCPARRPCRESSRTCLHRQAQVGIQFEKLGFFECSQSAYLIYHAHY